jgi:hypothetical protein
LLIFAQVRVDRRRHSNPLLCIQNHRAEQRLIWEDRKPWTRR